MGQSKCSQYCERGARIGCESFVGPIGYPSCEDLSDYLGEHTSPCFGSEAEQPFCEALPIAALAYTPPPEEEARRAAEMLLGTSLPQKPAIEKTYGVPPRVQGSSSRYASSRYPSCARPGEPINQVFVFFSNDLEGFLPYTLVISEEEGLEFTSLSNAPDFLLSPLNIIKVELVAYDSLMNDVFFAKYSKSILSRPGRPGGSSTPPQPRSRPGLAPETALEKDRVRPPYNSVVQLSTKRAAFEGGQVLIFIAVQSEPLAEELAKSCNALKKRRVLKQLAQARGSHAGEDFICDGMSTPTRGCPTPRTLGSRTPGETTPACSTGVSPARTPIRTPRQQRPHVEGAKLPQTLQSGCVARNNGGQRPNLTV